MNFCHIHSVILNRSCKYSSFIRVNNVLKMHFYQFFNLSHIDIQQIETFDPRGKIYCIKTSLTREGVMKRAGCSRPSYSFLLVDVDHCTFLLVNADGTFHGQLFSQKYYLTSSKCFLIINIAIILKNTMYVTDKLASRWSW